MERRGRILRLRLGLFLDLATYETLPQWLTISVSIAGGVGILVLAIFLFGKWPTFQSEQPSEVTSRGDTKEKDSAGAGCVGNFVLGGVALALRMLLKNNKKWLGWVPGDVESWAVLEMFVVLVLYVVFGVWFAVAKIRLRHKLGGMSAVLGSTELLIAALHLTMLAIGIGILIITVAENPNIDEAAIDEVFNARVKVAIIVSGASYCVWSVVTMLFFASVRRRSEPDWRLEFQTETTNRG